MKRRTGLMAATIVGAVVVLTGGVLAQGKADIALRAAIETETIKGDLKAAIDQYKAIAAGSDRAAAAKALLRMGQCYEKLGDTEARKAYEKIVAQFADQKDVADEARKRLGARGAAAPVETGLVERHVWSFPPSDKGDNSTAFRWLGGVSADGRLVAVAARNKYFALNRVSLLDLASGHERTVADNTHCWSVFLAPDARQIACGWGDESTSTGGYEIRVIQVGDGSMRTVWRDEGQSILVHGWSPDGKYILSRTLKKAGGPWDMVLVSVADGSVKVLKTGGGVGATSEPRFSPDGRYIVHPAFRTRSDGTPISSTSGNVSILHIMPVAGGTETPLVQGAATESDWSPAWTPDGRRVVFISNRSGEAAVWAATVVDGKPVGEPERLKMSVGGEGYGLIGFARDGTLYCRRGMSTSDVLLAEIDAESGTVVGEPKRVNQAYVGTTGGPVAWSPDGQWLAYNRVLNSQRTLVVHRMNTGEDRELPQADPAVAGWFPGGQSLLAGNKRIDVMSGRQESIPGLEREQPEPGTAMAQAIALSHDGRSVYYCVNDGDAAKNNGRYTVHLIRHDVESGQKREIYQTTSPIPGLYSIAVSPDDRLVAFGELRLLTEGGMSVKVISAEGGDAREVFSRFSWGVAWGVDGRYLLLKGAGMDGKLEFLWVPVAGGPARPSGLRAGDITLNASTDGARAFAVHPNGRHVAFADSGYQQEIVAIKNLLADQKPAR